MRRACLILVCLLPLACQRPGASLRSFPPLPAPTAWMHSLLGTDLEKPKPQPTRPWTYELKPGCSLRYELRGSYTQREPGVERIMRLKGGFSLEATKEGPRATFEPLTLTRQLEGPDKPAVTSEPTKPEVAVLTRVEGRRGLVEVGAPSTGWRAYGVFRGVGALFPTLPQGRGGPWTISLQDPERAVTVGRTRDAGPETKESEGLEVLKMHVERGDWFKAREGEVFITRAHLAEDERWTVFTLYHEAGYVVASQLLHDVEVPGVRAGRLDVEIRLTKGCEATPLVLPFGSERR